MNHDYEKKEQLIQSRIRGRDYFNDKEVDAYMDMGMDIYAEHMAAPLEARIKELEDALQRAHLSLYENELEAAEAYRIDRPIFRHHPLLIKETRCRVCAAIA